MVGKGAVPYAQVAESSKLTEGAVRVAVHRLRGRYRELLRDEVRQTISDPTQVDEEMRALFSAFSE
jgi:RNA polymerase sigma-70 factor (ECF subfamily)